MAYLSNCDVCGKKLVDSHRCCECEPAFLEDVLSQLQKLFRSRRLIIADEVLKERLRTGKFRTLDEFKRDKEAGEAVHEQKERELEAWRRRLQTFLEHARKEFELRDPCPKPIEYGFVDLSSKEEDVEKIFERLRERRGDTTRRLRDDGEGS